VIAGARCVRVLLLGTAACLATSSLISCSGDDDNAVLGSTVTTSEVERRLLRASDLPGYELVAGEPAMGTCRVEMHNGARQAQQAFVSNAAQELVRYELFEFPSAPAAEAAFDAAWKASRCDESEIGGNDGRPTAADIRGADRAFSIDYVDTRDANGATVALARTFVIVVSVTVHQGPATADPLGSIEITERAIGRV
jgi:hypothetical protein